MATAAPSAPALPLDHSTRLRARHTRTQVLGLLILATFATIFSAVLALEDPGELAFAGPILGVVLLAAYLSWRFGTWSKVVGALVGLALGGMMSGFAIHHGRFVSSILDFVPSVLLLVGASLAVGGGAAAIVRRRHQEAVATPLERRIRVGVLGALALAVLVSASLHIAGMNSVSAAEAAGATPVTMSEFEFAEGSYQVAAGEAVLVKNTDLFAHDFTVPALGIKEVLVPGSEALIAIDAEPGTYQVICTPHAGMTDEGVYEGMTAELIVR